MNSFLHQNNRTRILSTLAIAATAAFTAAAPVSGFAGDRAAASRHHHKMVSYVSAPQRGTTDRVVVTAESVQNGSTQDQVRAAWGAPSEVEVVNTPAGPREQWTYTRSFNGLSGGFFGVSRGWVKGAHGYRFDTDDFYPAPSDAQTFGGTTAGTEVPVKRAEFAKGQVVSHQTVGDDDDAN